MTLKTNPGNFFEDFTAGQTLVHAVPRTITEGDCALYIGLTGDRYPLHCSAEFARSLGYAMPICVCVVSFGMWSITARDGPHSGSRWSLGFQFPKSRPIESRSGSQSRAPATLIIVPLGWNRRQWCARISAVVAAWIPSAVPRRSFDNGAG